MNIAGVFAESIDLINKYRRLFDKFIAKIYVLLPLDFELHQNTVVLMSKVTYKQSEVKNYRILIKFFGEEKERNLNFAIKIFDI